MTDRIKLAEELEAVEQRIAEFDATIASYKPATASIAATAALGSLKRRRDELAACAAALKAGE